MRKTVITILVFFIIAFSLFFAWLAFTPVDYATSLIPGWHTVVTPPGFFLSFFIIPWIVFTVLIYVWAAVKKWPLNKLLIIIHVLLSIPLLIVYIYDSNINLDFSSDNIEFVFKSFFFAAIAFMIGQIFFMLQLITTYKKIKSRLL